MVRLFKGRSKAAGLPPGTPVHIGELKLAQVTIHVLDYDETKVEEREVQEVEQCFAFKDKPTVTWINVNGVHDVQVIQRLGDHFGLHPLVMEDVANTGQRPKVEDYGQYVYLVAKMLSYADESHELQAEQVSLILGAGFVISFQEQEGDVFDPVRGRIRSAKGRVRTMGADYLVYALLDSIVDGYFAVLEKLSERVEDLQEAVTSDPRPETQREIHNLKREMIFLRKSVWPLREAVSGLQREESPLVSGATRVYLRDLYDHTIQVIDTTETLRDMVAGVLDTYLASISNRMNEVMKVLTIMASLFIPITFIAGIYGMNFQYMPELGWRWGYPAVWAVVIGTMASMLAYFRKKRWI